MQYQVCPADVDVLHQDVKLFLYNMAHNEVL